MERRRCKGESKSYGTGSDGEERAYTHSGGMGIKGGGEAECKERKKEDVMLRERRE